MYSIVSSFVFLILQQITELVHQRDMTRILVNNKITSPKSFEWLSQMRFYFNSKVTDVLQQLSIHMANAQFTYSFEYLGVQDKLVQTPLTDRCYLTMTQALEERLGGSPFGKDFLCERHAQCNGVTVVSAFMCMHTLVHMFLCMRLW